MCINIVKISPFVILIREIISKKFDTRNNKIDVFGGLFVMKKIRKKRERKRGKKKNPIFAISLKQKLFSPQIGNAI